MDLLAVKKVKEKRRLFPGKEIIMQGATLKTFLRAQFCDLGSDDRAK